MAHAPWYHAAIFGAVTIALSLAGSVPATAQPLWGHDMIGRAYAFERGFTGAGVVVGIYDEAARATHNEYRDRFLGGYNGGGSLPFAGPQMHGTHVAGTVAGRNVGVAPGALLYSLNAVGKPDFEAADAYRWAYAKGVRIFNNSWSLRANGSTFKITDATRAFMEAVQPHTMAALFEGASLGALQIFATDNYNQTQPGAYAGLPYLYPELQDLWLAVTAVGPSGSRASYANHCGLAAMWCLTAPGGEGAGTDDAIWSAYHDGDNRYAAISGTSMATPHVTGAVAIAAQMFPRATNAELASLILQTATDIGAPGIDSVFGWGMLNLRNVVDSINPETATVYTAATQARLRAMSDVTDVLRTHASGDITRTTPLEPNTYVAPTGGAASAAIADAMLDPVQRQAWFTPMFGAQISADHTNQVVGGVAGLDLYASKDFRFGLGAGFTAATTQQAGADNSGISQNLHLGFYGHWTRDGWFFDGTAQAASLSQAITRNAISGATGTSSSPSGSAHFSGIGLEAGGEFGHRFDVPDVGAFSPYALLMARHQQVGAAQETGAGVFGLELAAHEYSQAEIGLGLRFQSLPIALDDSDLTFLLDASYSRLLGDTDLNSTATLLGRPITTTTGHLDPNIVRFGGAFNLTSTTVSGMSFFGRYGAQIQGETVSHAASVGLKLSF